MKIFGALLSRLSPLNLPLSCQHFECRFQIYSQQTEIDTYRNHINIRQLKEVLPVDFLVIDIDQSKNKYYIASRIQQKAVQSGYQQKSAVLIDAPDLIFGQQVYKECLLFIKQNKRLIVTPSFSLDLEDFTSHPSYKKTLKTELFSVIQIF